MKFRLTLLLVLLVISLPYCIIHKKEQYNIPANTTKEARAELLKTIARGKALYKGNCSGCHGIFQKGKDGVPDFTETQLDKYTTRYIMQDATNHAVAFKMHPEQLHEILVYLRHRIIKRVVKS